MRKTIKYDSKSSAWLHFHSRIGYSKTYICIYVCIYYLLGVNQEGLEEAGRGIEVVAMSVCPGATTKDFVSSQTLLAFAYIFCVCM